MAASIAAVSSGSIAGGAVSVAVPSGTASGDLLVAVYLADSDGAFASMTAGSTGFTEQYSSSAVSTAAGFGKIFTKTAGGSESTYSFPGSAGSTNTVFVFRVTGHNSAAPFAAAPTWTRPAPASTTTFTSPTAALSVNGVLFVGYNEQGLFAAQTIGAPSGMTGNYVLDPANYMGTQVAYLTGQSAGTSTARTATASNAGSTGTVGYLTFAFAVADAVPAPATVSAVAGVPNPGVRTPAAPAVLAAVAAVPGSTVNTGSLVSASTVSGTGGVPAPTAQAGAVAAVSAVSAAAAIPGPAVSGSAGATPAAVAAVAGVSAPTILTGSSVAASTAAAVAGVPAPVVQSGGSATPAPGVVPALAAVGAPSVTTGSVVTLSTVVGTAAVAAVTIGSNASVAPATVTGSAGVGALSVQVPLLTQTVAAIAGIPTPGVVSSLAGGDLTAAHRATSTLTTRPRVAATLTARPRPRATLTGGPS